jgi:T3SS negative regulator,GrlR
MLDGLWIVTITTADGSGHGVVVLTNGNVLGGDSGSTYVGTFTNGINIKATVLVQSFDPSVGNILGIQGDFTLDLDLQVTGDNQLDGTASSPQDPGTVVSVNLVRKSPLTSLAPPSFTIVKLNCDPSQPTAGQGFRLLVELAENAPVDLQVSLEEQRIVQSRGGEPLLVSTGTQYFDLGPRPVKVERGKNYGTSEVIQVKKNPQGEQGDPPVRFPEQLLFTAFGDPSARFRSIVVTILGPPDATPAN